MDTIATDEMLRKYGQVVKGYAWDPDYGKLYSSGGDEAVGRRRSPTGGQQAFTGPLTTDARLRAGLAERTFFDSPEYKNGVERNPSVWDGLDRMVYSATNDLLSAMNRGDRDQVDASLQLMEDFVKDNRNDLNAMAYTARQYKDNKSQGLAVLADSLVNGMWMEGIKGAGGMTLAQYVREETPVDKAKRSFGFSESAASGWANPQDKNYAAYDFLRGLYASAGRANVASASGQVPRDGLAFPQEAVSRFAQSFSQLVDKGVFNDAADADDFASSAYELGFIGGGEDLHALQTYATARGKAKSLDGSFDGNAWTTGFKRLYDAVAPMVNQPVGDSGGVKAVRDPLSPDPMIRATVVGLLDLYNKDGKVFNPNDSKVSAALKAAIGQRNALERAGGYLPKEMNDIVSKSVYARLVGDNSGDRLSLLGNVASAVASSMGGHYDSSTGGTSFTRSFDKEVFGAIIGQLIGGTRNGGDLARVISTGGLADLQSSTGARDLLVKETVDSIIGRFYDNVGDEEAPSYVAKPWSPFGSLRQATAKQVLTKVLDNMLTGNRNPKSAFSIIEGLADLDEAKVESGFVDLSPNSKASPQKQREQREYRQQVLAEASKQDPSGTMFEGVDSDVRAAIVAGVDVGTRDASAPDWLSTRADDDRYNKAVQHGGVLAAYTYTPPSDLLPDEQQAKFTKFIKSGRLFRVISQADVSIWSDNMQPADREDLSAIVNGLAQTCLDSTKSREARADASQFLVYLWPVLFNSVAPDSWAKTYRSGSPIATPTRPPSQHATPIELPPSILELPPSRILELLPLNRLNQMLDLPSELDALDSTVREAAHKFQPVTPTRPPSLELPPSINRLDQLLDIHSAPDDRDSTVREAAHKLQAYASNLAVRGRESPWEAMGYTPDIDKLGEKQGFNLTGVTNAAVKKIAGAAAVKRATREAEEFKKANPDADDLRDDARAYLNSHSTDDLISTYVEELTAKVARGAFSLPGDDQIKSAVYQVVQPIVESVRGLQPTTALRLLKQEAKKVGLVFFKTKSGTVIPMAFTSNAELVDSWRRANNFVGNDNVKDEDIIAARLEEQPALRVEYANQQRIREYSEKQEVASRARGD